MKIAKKVSKEMEVKMSISDVWEIYGSLKLAMMLKSELGHLFGVEIFEVEGGGVGTIFQVTPNPEFSKISPYKEKITKIDHEKRVKEIESIEGGFLEFGLSFYRITLEVLECETQGSCIARITIEYEGDEDVISNLDEEIVVKPNMDVFEFVNRYIEKNS